MSGSNHVAGGVVFTGVFLSMYDINIFSSPTFIFFTGFFSLLPDADHTKSFIGKLIYPVAKFVNRKYGHRTITHSLMFYIIGYVIVSFIVKATSSNPVIAQIYLWAFGSHLIFDMLTKQGIPLFYPFKKNPCVMPANPIYRLRASDLKTEATIFLVFGLIAFTCKNLFANGFWNTYNASFDDIKHTYEEHRKFDGVIKVDYYFREYQGEGYLVDASATTAILFTKEGFVNVKNTDNVKLFKPTRTELIRKDLQILINDISIDSFKILVRDKAIKDLKVQAALPLSFSKDNEPQSSTSVNLSYVFNPVFRSNDIDSINAEVEKEISLTKIQLEAVANTKKIFAEKKKRIFIELTAAQENLSNIDLAIKEKAIKEFPQLQKTYASLQEPTETTQQIQIRLAYLNQKLHIRKTQKISGFISYITFKNNSNEK